MRVLSRLFVVIFLAGGFATAPSYAANAQGQSSLPEAQAGSRSAGDAGMTVIGQPSPDEPHIDFDGPPTPNDITVASMAIARERAEAASRPAGLARPTFEPSSGDYTLIYNDTMPADQEAVMEAVMAEWAGAVDFNSGDIVIEVNYADFGAGALAAASKNSAVVEVDGVRYSLPTAVINAAAGFDRFPSDSDIFVYINSNRTWNTQTSGDIGFYDYSLFTTLLHEVGHGLGFSSSIRPTSTPSSILGAFDLSVFFGEANAAGDSPLDPTPALGAPQTETDHAWFLNLDGTWERVYDPTTFASGSSMSHFDEATYGRHQPGALMSPALSNGETAYEVDGVVLGVMEAIGWVLEDPPVAPAVAVDGSTGSIVITITPSASTDAPPASRYGIDVRRDDATVWSGEFAARQHIFEVPTSVGSGDLSVSVQALGSGGAADAVGNEVDVADEPTPPSTPGSPGQPNPSQPDPDSPAATDDQPAVDRADLCAVSQSGGSSPAAAATSVPPAGGAWQLPPLDEAEVLDSIGACTGSLDQSWGPTHGKTAERVLAARQSGTPAA